MTFYPTEQDRINRIIASGAKGQMQLDEFIKLRTDEWLSSDKRNMMLVGEQYYLNHTDIQKKKTELENRSNIKLEHAFIRKLVDQKIGYLLSKQPSIKSNDDTYTDLLNTIFNRSFLRVLKNVGKDAINKGIAWLQIYFDAEANNIAFKRIPSEEIIPFWNDEAHTSLDAVVRVYEIEVYEGKEKKLVKKIEFWDRHGVKFYIYESNGLTPDVERDIESSHFFIENGNAKVSYNWNRPPFVAFKYNDEEQPLVDIIKSLIDNYNQQASINSDLLADIPKLIYILRNYGGEDLDEFLYLLNKYRAIKVADQGGVDKLQAEPNAKAIEGLLAQARRDIIEYGRGIDVQNENLGNASGVALKFRYSDLDMDCNIIETEFQAAFEDLIWFVNCYFSMAGKGDYGDAEAEIIFNRDIIISESDAINDCRNSLGIISLETIISQHPWVGDATVELERLKKEENIDYQYPGLGRKDMSGDEDE